MRKRSYSANSTGSQGQGIGHREGQAACHQHRCPRLPVPPASAAPEAAPDPRRGASWSGRATSASCQKEFRLQMPCREGRLQGGEGAWLLGARRLLSFRHSRSEPGGDPCPRAERFAWDTGMEAVGRGQLHHLRLPRGQRPLNACLSGPASPRAPGLCPTLTRLVVLTCQHTQEQTHCTQLTGGRKTVCEKVGREREARRPNRDRHTEAQRNPHAETRRETWAVTGRENRGDDWVPDRQAGRSPEDRCRRTWRLRGTKGLLHLSRLVRPSCKLCVCSLSLMAEEHGEGWGEVGRGLTQPMPRNIGDHR